MLIIKCTNAIKNEVIPDTRKRLKCDSVKCGNCPMLKVKSEVM
jgi:hypothetical protein